MASARNPGPLGRNLEVQDLNDGTLFRGLSPRPGPIGVNHTSTHGNLFTVGASTSELNQLLPQMQAAGIDIKTAIDIVQWLREKGNALDWQRINLLLFGQQCFVAGVVAGIVEDIYNDLGDLLELGWTLMLADLHDINNGKGIWFNPTARSVAWLAGRHMPDKLRAAAEERDALIRELTEAIRNPLETFEEILDLVAEEYKKDWDKFNVYIKDGTLNGLFEAGQDLR